MSFWIIIYALTALASVLVAWLLLRSIPPTTEDMQQQRIGRNVGLYRQRLARLEDEREKAFIDQAEFDQQQTELARQLLKEVESLNHAPQQSQQRKKWLYLLLVPVPLLALVLYAAVGAWPDWQISEQLHQLSQSRNMEEYQQRFAVAHQAIEQRLEQRPDHTEYRLLLANHAMSQQQYQTAAMHYGILAELLPEDDEILALYAQAEYLRNGRKLTAGVAEYMDKVLKLNPQNRTILGLQGIHAMETGDFTAAISAWQALLNTLPEDAQEAELIRQGIAAAREQLAKTGVTDDQPDTAANEGVQVRVELADALTTLDKQLTVFVYARAANGPPMPLAARKLKLADLPARLQLDDASAMMPQMKLSDFEQVIIGARISMSGDPVARNGDYQAESPAIRWREQSSISLTIQDKVVR